MANLQETHPPITLDLGQAGLTAGAPLLDGGATKAEDAVLGVGRAHCVEGVEEPFLRRQATTQLTQHPKGLHRRAGGFTLVARVVAPEGGRNGGRHSLQLKSGGDRRGDERTQRPPLEGGGGGAVVAVLVVVAPDESRLALLEQPLAIEKPKRGWRRRQRAEVDVVEVEGVYGGRRRGLGRRGGVTPDAGRVVGVAVLATE